MTQIIIYAGITSTRQRDVASIKERALHDVYATYQKK